MTYCRERDDALCGLAAGGDDDALLAHLQQCEGCAAELERRRALMARIDAAAREIAAVPAPAITIAARQPPRWNARYAFAACAAAIVLAVIILAGRMPQRTPPAQSIVTWHSPTANLLRSTVSIVNAPLTLKESRL